MNRRSFLIRSLAFLPLPAFARAASLWLPKEKPFFVPDKTVEFAAKFTLHDAPAGWIPKGTAYMYNYHVWLHPEQKAAIEAHILEHARLLGINPVARGEP